ncbi:MAG: hypothetical protein CLLPBCKN_000920 [Chroococcidiopsis cubana SAG 39.79]|uniref:hypothetical protein n=1 Tax=Chroococcidiopsis cubana TaxID=171392 RepID=UPI000F8ED6C1|nr:hypothetical protein [Chroococcidiopsis cubana]MDZ4871532.1 hypothetical protein [Chroococcidiopsis cubana SAG 39.79]
MYVKTRHLFIQRNRPVSQFWQDLQLYRSRMSIKWQLQSWLASPADVRQDLRIGSTLLIRQEIQPLNLYQPLGDRKPSRHDLPEFGKRVCRRSLLSDRNCPFS